MSKMRLLLLVFCLLASLHGISQLETVPQSYSKAFITHAIYSRAQQIIAQSEYRCSFVKYMGR